jgi:hypothetical protein
LVQVALVVSELTVLILFSVLLPVRVAVVVVGSLVLVVLVAVDFVMLQVGLEQQAKVLLVVLVVVLQEIQQAVAVAVVVAQSVLMVA